jgi:hypothetical protein
VNDKVLTSKRRQAAAALQQAAGAALFFPRFCLHQSEDKGNSPEGGEKQDCPHAKSIDVGCNRERLNLAYHGATNGKRDA